MLYIVRNELNNNYFDYFSPNKLCYHEALIVPRA